MVQGSTLWPIARGGPSGAALAGQLATPSVRFGPLPEGAARPLQGQAIMTKVVIMKHEG